MTLHKFIFGVLLERPEISNQELHSLDVKQFPNDAPVWVKSVASNYRNKFFRLKPDKRMPRNQ